MTQHGLGSSLHQSPPTRAQLPKNAATYYAKSVPQGHHALFEYEYLGKDVYGCRCYQLRLDGELYGMPRALLSYRDYCAAVRSAAKLVRDCGVPRWTTPSGPIK